MPIKSGPACGFLLKIYQNSVDNQEHIALVKGRITANTPILVRIHRLNLFDDYLAMAQPDRSEELAGAIAMIAKQQAGVIVILYTDHNRPSEMLKKQIRDKQNTDTGNRSEHLREYGVGAQILLDLGVRDIALLSNSPPLMPIALDGYGLRLIRHIPIPPPGA